MIRVTREFKKYLQLWMPLHDFVTAFNIFIPMNTVMNFALILAVVATVSCTTSPSPQPADVNAPAESAQTAQSTVAKDVDVQTFHQMMADHPEAIVLDVRTPEEVAAGMIPSAKHIDFYDPNFASLIGEFPKDKPVMVYCAAGGRSGQAMNKMKGLGFLEVYNLNGGYRAWSSAGMPTTK